MLFRSQDLRGHDPALAVVHDEHRAGVEGDVGHAEGVEHGRQHGPVGAQDGALLDGFPRTLAQAEALETLLGDDGVKLVINLEAPFELVTKRLSSRRVCQECGAIYRESDPAAISQSCEQCGGDVVQRSDDQPEAIRRRLEAYERDTAPLLDFYADRGLLVSLNGDQSPEAVTADIVSVLTERGLR